MCCDNEMSYNVNKVSPDGYVQTKQHGRKNGWTWPWHPLQIVGWFFLTLFAVTHFSIIAFYLPLEWKAAGIIIPACGFIIHVVYHFLALTLDPADPAVRIKGYYVKSEFDRAKHKHVIENLFCYICQTKVSPRSKHCSVCNKCVSEFDHHCKWLNNCIGGRNYKLFLGSCISAFLTALMVFIIDLYIIILYSSNCLELLSRSGKTTWTIWEETSKEAVIVFFAVNAALLLIALLLLGHLLLFHIYLLYRNMSTYEYIVRGRERAVVNDMNSDIESALDETTPPPPLKSGHHYENHYTSENKDKSSHEMEVVEDNIKIYNGDITNASLPGEVIEENQVAKQGNLSFSENGAPDKLSSSSDQIVYQSKKKRKLKHRTSSRMELLHSSDPSDRDEELSDARSPSVTSNKTEDSELERYKYTKNEMVLENFKSPDLSIRSGKLSRPTQLMEDRLSSIGVIQDQPRNESIISRPRSPSPKSDRVSTDQILDARAKASQSSLSTLNLIDLEEDGKPKAPRLSPTKEESDVSKSSSRSIRESYTKQIFTEERVNTAEPIDQIPKAESLSSQISLSNLLQSKIVSPVSSAKRSGSSNSKRTASRSSLKQEDHEETLPNECIDISQTSHPQTPVPPKEIISENQNISSKALSLQDMPVQSEQDVHSELTKKSSPSSSPRSSTNSKSSKDESNQNQELDLKQEEYPEQPQKNLITSETNEQLDEHKKGMPEDVDSVNIKESQEKDNTVEETKKVLKDTTDDEMLIFEDEFADVSEQNNEFLQNSFLGNSLANQNNSGANFENSPHDQYGIKPKNRQSSQYSYGSDSDRSDQEVPLALLSEETNTYALKDSLNRVKKLSDAFPSAVDQDKLKKRSLPAPRFRTAESMAEISVVEYNRKKKLRKKRPNMGGNKQKTLPPLRGAKPLPQLSEEDLV